MSEELKPCPFCGKPAKWEKKFLIGGIARCSDYQCIGAFTHLSRSAASGEWNTRPAEDALKEDVERLKEALTQIGIAMLYSEDEKADEIFKLCEEKVGDSLKRAYVEKLQEDIEKMGLNHDTGKGGEDE